MNYRIKFTNRFMREHKLMQKRGANMKLLSDVVDLLRQGKSLPEKYRDHALTGNYSGSRECHIKPDWLLIYQIENNFLVLTLIRTGTHSDLF